MNFKKIFIVLLIFILIFEPTAFAAKTAYTNKNTYVYKKPSTSSARKSISINTKLYYVGSIGKFYCVKIVGYNTKVFILKQYVSKNKTIKKQTTTASSSWKTKVIKVNWDSGKNYLKIGKTVTLYSTEKDIEFSIKRVGGTNHMDIEPLTSSDTEKLLNVAEGIFSWKTHPMILKIDNKYIACSINSMPHGKEVNKNNDFEGHFCLHLVNSKTHGTNTINQEHQKCIEKAYNWAHK